MGQGRELWFFTLKTYEKFPAAPCFITRAIVREAGSQCGGDATVGGGAVGGGDVVEVDDGAGMGVDDGGTDVVPPDGALEWPELLHAEAPQDNKTAARANPVERSALDCPIRAAAMEPLYPSEV